MPITFVETEQLTQTITITPVLVWIGIGTLITITLLLTIVIVYHWFNYSYSPQTTSKVITIYGVGGGILLAVILSSALIYTLSI